MEFHISCQTFVALFLLMQGCSSFDRKPGKDPRAKVVALQTSVEQLIEKILLAVEDQYHRLNSEFKCIPEEVPDNIIRTLKDSIDCVDENEKNYQARLLSFRHHQKNFFKCFSKASKEVDKIMAKIDPNKDYCPDNMTEKTYQINVTTALTKTFNIVIKNGLILDKKTIQTQSSLLPCYMGAEMMHPIHHPSGDDSADNDDKKPPNSTSGGKGQASHKLGKDHLMDKGKIANVSKNIDEGKDENEPKEVIVDGDYGEDDTNDSAEYEYLEEDIGNDYYTEDDYLEDVTVNDESKENDDGNDHSRDLEVSLDNLDVMGDEDTTNKTDMEDLSDQVRSSNWQSKHKTSNKTGINVSKLKNKRHHEHYFQHPNIRAHQSEFLYQPADVSN